MIKLEDAWQKIKASDEYNDYNDEVRTQVKQRFFERTVGASQQYRAADTMTQQKIQSRFEERLNPSMLSRLRQGASELGKFAGAEIKAKGILGTAQEVFEATPAGKAAKYVGEKGHKFVEGMEGRDKESLAGKAGGLTSKAIDVATTGGIEADDPSIVGKPYEANVKLGSFIGGVGKELIKGVVPESSLGVAFQVGIDPAIGIAKKLPILGADVGKMAESLIGKFRGLKELPPIRLNEPLRGLIDDEKAYEAKLREMAGLSGNPLYEPFTPEFKTNISQLRDYRHEKLIDVRAEDPHLRQLAKTETNVAAKKAAEERPKDPFMQAKWMGKAEHEGAAIDPDVKKFTERNLSDITQKPLRNILKEINDDLGYIGSVRFWPSNEDPAVLEAAKDLRVAVKSADGTIFKDKFGADAHARVAASAKTMQGAIEGFWDELSKKFYSREDAARLLGWAEQRVKRSGGLMATELRELHNNWKKLGEKGEIRLPGGSDSGIPEKPDAIEEQIKDAQFRGMLQEAMKPGAIEDFQKKAVGSIIEMPDGKFFVNSDLLKGNEELEDFANKYVKSKAKLVGIEGRILDITDKDALERFTGLFKIKKATIYEPPGSKGLGEKGEVSLGGYDINLLNAAKDLRAAVKLPDGKVEIGKFGEGHGDAFSSKISEKIMNKSELGFYDNLTKKFISHEEASKYLGPRKSMFGQDMLLGAELKNMHAAYATYLKDLAKIKDISSKQIIKNINKEVGEKGEVSLGGAPEERKSNKEIAAMGREMRLAEIKLKKLRGEINEELDNLPEVKKLSSDYFEKKDAFWKYVDSLPFNINAISAKEFESRPESVKYEQLKSIMKEASDKFLALHDELAKIYGIGWGTAEDYPYSIETQMKAEKNWGTHPKVAEVKELHKKISKISVELDKYSDIKYAPAKIFNKDDELDVKKTTRNEINWLEKEWKPGYHAIQDQNPEGPEWVLQKSDTVSTDLMFEGEPDNPNVISMGLEGAHPYESKSNVIAYLKYIEKNPGEYGFSARTLDKLNKKLGEKGEISLGGAPEERKSNKEIAAELLKKINKEAGESGNVWADGDPERYDRIKQNIRELIRRGQRIGYDNTDEIIQWAERNYVSKDELHFIVDEFKAEEQAPLDPRPISEMLQAAVGNREAKNTLWEKVKDRWTPDGTASKIKTLLTKRYGEIAEGKLDSQYFIHNTLKQLTKAEREAMSFKGMAPEPERLRWPNAEEIIKLINHPTENMKKADKTLTQYMEEAHQFLSDNFEDIGYVKDYVTLLWDKPTDILLNPKINESGTYNPFLNKRSFPNYAAGINAGQQPKTLDIKDIVSVYDKYKIKTVANVRFFDELAKMPTPEGLPAVMPANRAPIGWLKANNIPALIGKRVHPDYLQAVKVVTDAPFSNKALRAYDILAESQRYASLTLSPFHFGSLFTVGSLSTDVPFKIPLKVLSSTGKYIMREAAADKSEASMWSKVLSAYREGHAAFIDLPLAKRATRAGLNLGMIGREHVGGLENFLMSTEAKLNRFYIGKGIKAIRGIKEIFDKPLWDYLHAGMKLMTFQEHLIDNLKKFPEMPINEIERKTASYVNDLDGGEAWETLFVSPQYQKSLHRALFFPDWLVSRLRTLGAVVKPVGLTSVKEATTRSPEAYQAQKFWLRAALGYYTFANWRNYVNTKKAYGKGHFMWDNDPGKSMDVFNKTDEKGRALYSNYAPAITEVFKWFHKPVKALGARFNPNLQLMTEFFTGSTLSGYRLPESKRDFTSIIKRHYTPIMAGGSNELGLYPISKGISSWEVVKRFEGVIQKGDDPSIAIQYGTQNGYDVEKLFNIARRNVRAKLKKEALNN